MPLVTFNNEIAGPTIEIGISISQGQGPASIPPANTAWIKAIADTGAMCTCIGLDIATKAGLPVIGIGSIQSATHVLPVKQFFGDLWIRARLVGGAGFACPFRGMVFHELSLPGTSHDALLGMDVLGEGIMVVHGPDGRTTFSW